MPVWVCVSGCVCMSLECVCLSVMYVSACICEYTCVHLCVSECVSVVYTSVYVCVHFLSKCMLPVCESSCLLCLCSCYLCVCVVCWVALLLGGAWVHMFIRMYIL